MWNIFKKSIARVKVKPAVVPTRPAVARAESGREALAKRTGQIKRVPEIAKLAPAAQDKTSAGRAETIFLKPVATEKSSSLGIYNTYAFVVADSANKIEIKKAFREVYGARPEKITIINAKPKTRVFRKRAGIQPGFKKALVRLPAGVKVDIFEGV